MVSKLEKQLLEVWKWKIIKLTVDINDELLTILNLYLANSNIYRSSEIVLFSLTYKIGKIQSENSIPLTS